MQKHVGDYLKQIVVNQGIQIKDFANIYGTSAPHMSDILSKKDLSTRILRKFESLLHIEFSLTSSLNNNELLNEKSIQYAKIKNSAGGRPPEFKHRNTQEAITSITVNQEVLLKEIEGLKALLASKDQLIKSKDDLIQALTANKI
ncbi:hypothetical protein [Arcicella rosea]|uniref:Helix-turn-helix n=1 Tax=Arcicella rosea TaxID=502909 RepID=A0A841ER82_9BACT|nr:hypothetical protein [Arcicella rosea]MBB6002770.1 hypothetical protein [Arcicella rosea]